MPQSHGEDAAGADAREQDDAPSRRFRILFTLAMLIIALGYTWVWQVKTERVVAESAPVLALSAAMSYITPEAESDGEALGVALLAELQRIRGLTVLDARARRPAEPEIEQLLAAELRPGGAGQVLELSRSDAKTGRVIYRYRVEGTTMEETVYRMSVQVAMSFGLPRPEPRGSAAR